MFGLGVVRPNIFEKEFFFYKYGFLNLVLEKGDNLKHVLVSRLKNL